MKPKKNLGQNFLRNRGIAANTAKSIPFEKNDLILEIGPGEGALTKFLCKEYPKVIAIEKDREAINFLKKADNDLFEKVESGSLEIIESDILNLPAETKKGLSETNFHLVGNLPFNISKAIMRIFLEGCEVPKPISITVMLQKEVGEQFLGKKKSFMSFFAEFFAKEIKKIDFVRKTDFHPVPKVDALVIQLILRDQSELENLKNKLGIENEKKFWGFLKRLMIGKRKKIKNSLPKNFEGKEENMKNLLQMRVETLNLEEVAKIYSEFRKVKI